MNQPDTADGTPPKVEPMPRFWWLNPWREALEWKRRADNSLASGIKAAEKYAALFKDNSEMKVELLQQEGEIAKLRTDLSKTGEAVAWWKSSAESQYKLAKEQVEKRQAAEAELADVKNHRDTLLARGIQSAFQVNPPAKRKPAKKKGGKR